MALKLIKEAQGVVYAPPVTNTNPGAMYPRVIELHHAGFAFPGHSSDNTPKNGTLLATFEEYVPDQPVFPIYRSDDHGLTWYRFSEVPDTKNHWGNKFQPHLFEYPCQLGEFPAGTLMISGNSIPGRSTSSPGFGSTEIVCYISRDHGKTWEYLSSVVAGGASVLDSSDLDNRPVWEPYLEVDKNGDLVCYYSDERHMRDGYNQLLAYQVSKDGGRTWGNEVYNVAIADKVMRPGMPVVVKLPNGKYFMSYEIVGLPRFDVFYKLSEDGLDWGDPASFGTRAETADGKYLGSTPYSLWVPQGGPNGTILVSGRREGDSDGLRAPGYFHVNYHNGEGPWEQVEMPVQHDSRYSFTGYSQGMCLIQDNTRLLHLCPVEMNPQRAYIAYTISRLETV